MTQIQELKYTNNKEKITTVQTSLSNSLKKEVTCQFMFIQLMKTTTMLIAFQYHDHHQFYFFIIRYLSEVHVEASTKFGSHATGFIRVWRSQHNFLHTQDSNLRHLIKGETILPMHHNPCWLSSPFNDHGLVYIRGLILDSCVN